MARVAKLTCGRLFADCSCRGFRGRLKTQTNLVVSSPHAKLIPTTSIVKHKSGHPSSRLARKKKKRMKAFSQKYQIIALRGQEVICLVFLSSP